MPCSQARGKLVPSSMPRQRLYSGIRTHYLSVTFIQVSCMPRQIPPSKSTASTFSATTLPEISEVRNALGYPIIRCNSFVGYDNDTENVFTAYTYVFIHLLCGLIGVNISLEELQSNIRTVEEYYKRWVLVRFSGRKHT